MIQKLSASAKEALLDDLVAEGDGGTASEMIAGIRSAKTAQSRKQVRSLGAALCIGAISLVGFVHFTTSRLHEMKIANAPSQTPRRTAQSREIQPAKSFSIEKLDDDGLLDLLDTTPSALVEWPDGRRSLLLVVGEAR